MNRSFTPHRNEEEGQGGTGNVARLVKHVQSAYSSEANFQDMMTEINRMCPPRIKTTKRECEKCGKLRANQMRVHQQGSKCPGVHD